MIKSTYKFYKDLYKELKRFKRFYKKNVNTNILESVVEEYNNYHNKKMQFNPFIFPNDGTKNMKISLKTDIGMNILENAFYIHIIEYAMNDHLNIKRLRDVDLFESHMKYQKRLFVGYNLAMDTSMDVRFSDFNYRNKRINLKIYKLIVSIYKININRKFNRFYEYG